MEVLIVDDDPVIQAILWEVVRKAWPGAHPVTENDLEGAFRRLAHNRAPDLVLLDLGLPGHSGLDSLKRMRWKFPDVRVVVISAIADPKAVRRALDAGAAGFIPKATPPEEMIADLKALMGPRAAARSTGP
jgi:DNA-binding NarL/FixJ family response regulator